MNQLFIHSINHTLILYIFYDQKEFADIPDHVSGMHRPTIANDTHRREIMSNFCPGLAHLKEFTTKTAGPVNI